jgi:hypothetical protein
VFLPYLPEHPIDRVGMGIAEIEMSDAMADSVERFLRWIGRHPVTATAAALVMVAALAVPIARQTVSSSPGMQPPADLGPDETPLFV